MAPLASVDKDNTPHLSSYKGYFGTTFKGATIQLLVGGAGVFELDKLFISSPVCFIFFISHTASRKIFI